MVACKHCMNLLQIRVGKVTVVAFIVTCVVVAIEIEIHASDRTECLSSFMKCMFSEVSFFLRVWTYVIEDDSSALFVLILVFSVTLG